MYKCNSFKVGDKVTIKSMDEIKKEFKFEHKHEDYVSYRGPFDHYFDSLMAKFCGKEVTIDCKMSDPTGMVEGDNDYDFWSNLYSITEPVVRTTCGAKHDDFTDWSVLLFIEGRDAQ